LFEQGVLGGLEEQHDTSTLYFNADSSDALTMLAIQGVRHPEDRGELLHLLFLDLRKILVSLVIVPGFRTAVIARDQRYDTDVRRR
jgi:hypothetical protein